jgi:hypothetical protein
MDWPVIGAFTAVAVIGGGVVFEGVTMLRSTPAPVQSQHLLASYGSSVDRSAYDIPGFGSSGAGERPLSFPLIRLIDPDRDAEQAQAASADKAGATKQASPRQARKAAAPQDTTKAPQPASGEVKVAKLTPTAPDPGSVPGTGTATGTAPAALARPEQWRVVATANASYFNLGGHIDKAGVVDSLASSHLRDALKQHSKFGQLPPDIRTHILTQNIDLCRVAPYRSMLGMDDRILEQEQAVKFIRVR